MHAALQGSKTARGNRRERAAWWLAGLFLSALVALALPGEQIRLGAAELRGLVGSYLYSQPLILSAPTNARVTEIYLPKTVKVEWDDPMTNQEPTEWEYHVTRTDTVTQATTVYETTDKFWVDSFAFVYGRQYTYSVQSVPYSNPNSQLPSPPPGADPNDIATVYHESDPTAIEMTPMQAEAAYNQTVDSRYDLRYGNPTFLDFQFKDRSYLGGLFVGYANDPSRVGRSYLQFSLSSLPSGKYLWAGSVNITHTRSFGNGSVTVGCQPVDDAWNGSLLKWSTAPTLDPGDPTETITVSYNGTPTPAWHRWTMGNAIGGAILGDGLLSLGLASTSENSSGWAYFAKKEFDADLSPRVLYAYGGTQGVASVTVAPTSLTGGGSATGTVTLLSAAPSGGTTITLTALNLTVPNDPAPASLPSTVTVPAGATSATFQITTSSVSAATQVRIDAERVTGDVESAVLTVNP